MKQLLPYTNVVKIGNVKKKVFLKML